MRLQEQLRILHESWKNLHRISVLIVFQWKTDIPVIFQNFIRQILCKKNHRKRFNIEAESNVKKLNNEVMPLHCKHFIIIIITQEMSLIDYFGKQEIYVSMLTYG